MFISPWSFCLKVQTRRAAMLVTNPSCPKLQKNSPPCQPPTLHHRRFWTNGAIYCTCIHKWPTPRPDYYNNSASEASLSEWIWIKHQTYICILCYIFSSLGYVFFGNRFLGLYTFLNLTVLSNNFIYMYMYILVSI